MPILTAPQIYALARQAGWNATDAITATAIALAESGGNTSVVNGIGATGLWQILPAQAGSLDPVTNAQQAHAKFVGAQQAGGTGWCPWAVFGEDPKCPIVDKTRTNTWRNFLSVAQAAAGGITTPPDSGGGSGGGGGIGSIPILPGPFNPGSGTGNLPTAAEVFPVHGTVVVVAGILLFIVGGIAWKGEAVVKVFAGATPVGKAMRVARA